MCLHLFGSVFQAEKGILTERTLFLSTQKSWSRRSSLLAICASNGVAKVYRQGPAPIWRLVALQCSFQCKACREQDLNHHVHHQSVLQTTLKECRAVRPDFSFFCRDCQAGCNALARHCSQERESRQCDAELFPPERGGGEKSSMLCDSVLESNVL